MSNYYSRNELDSRGFGPFAVNVVDNFVLTLLDGGKIAIRIWFPGPLPDSLKENNKEWCWQYCAAAKHENNEEKTAKFPTIMEYLPYCKSHWTLERDHLRHPWMCSHGYVIIRVDMRGTGDSSGLYFDEYLKQEQDDAVEVIDWVSQQNWSNKAVGMFGKSWGGINGLQVAHCQPPALKAVISIYSTDNHYEDDCHWKGGCMANTQLLPWASMMFAFNARPPHPDKCAVPEWKDEWLKRLDLAGASWAQKWLKHQWCGDYFKDCSPSEDYGRLNIPILAIGGWHDMYSNAVLRLVDNVPTCRGIMGPWSHDWPDVAIPGPNIGFLNECLEFWDHNLKGHQIQRQLEAKKLTWYQMEGSLPPMPQVVTYPGAWHTRDNFQPDNNLSLYLDLDSTSASALTFQVPAGHASQEWPLDYDSSAGLTCGEMLSFGNPDLPVEQRFFNKPDATWLTTESLDKSLDLLGRPELKFDFQLCNDTQGALIAKLCDVFPDGQTKLICYGVLNLTHYRSDETPESLEIGKWYESSTVQLDGIGYTVLKGHKLCVSLSPSYWPQIFTPRSATKMVVRKVTMSLPLVNISCPEPSILRQKPTMGIALQKKVLKPPHFDRSLTFGLSNDKRVIRNVDDHGEVHYESEDLKTGHKIVAEYSIRDNNDPLSAKVNCHHDIMVEFFSSQPDKRQRSLVVTDSNLWADHDYFYTEDKLQVSLNDTPFFERVWKSKTLRRLV